MKTKQRAVIAVAVIVLLAAAVLGAKPAYNLYRDISFYHGERTEAEKTVKAFAEEQGISYGEYPQSLIDLYERNPETKDFVLNYPFRKDTGVDLSAWKDSRTVPLLLQWDPMGGYETVRAACERSAADAREREAKARESKKFEALSPREREVLELVAEGLSNREAAEKLGLSQETVKMHRSHAYGKLGIKSALEAFQWVKAEKEKETQGD